MSKLREAFSTEKRSLVRQLVFGFLILISFAQTSYAAKKKHQHTAAQSFTLLACEKLQTSCLQTSENTQSCKVTVKGKTLEENAYDSDNADCVKMRLWKKICAQGTPSEGLKVNCH